MEHDNSYKLLFAHPELVRDLLLGFVNTAWVRELDFATLERFSSSHVSDGLEDRHDDLIWRIRWAGHEWLYIFLILEFQSRVDTHMAVRIMAYVSLLYQELIRSERLPPSGKLPPVFPIVLYNGRRRWKAPQDMAELIEQASEELIPYQPRMRYLLLDISRLSKPALAPLKNLAAALFRLENSRGPEELKRAVHDLGTWLSLPEQDSLRRAFTVWLKRVLLPSRMPGVKLDAIHEMAEVESMLAERVMEWTRQWKQEGIKEGFQQGLAAQRALLLRMVKKRFDDACAQALAPLLDSIEDQERLAEIGEWIVTCDTAEALLARVRGNE